VISGNDTIRALLKDLFSERPADARDLYFTSALMDIRRAMADASQFVREEALGRYSLVPEDLRYGVSLPPWETDLLTQMFVGRPVILIEGGSGCGKTSALSFIRHYCRRIPLVDPYTFSGGGLPGGVSRPPVKPCMRISRTRLPGGFSVRGIMQSLGTGQCLASGRAQGCGRTRASSAPPRLAADCAPCAEPAGCATAARRRYRAG
jgi:hypothetical protein